LPPRHHILWIVSHCVQLDCPVIKTLQTSLLGSCPCWSVQLGLWCRGRLLNIHHPAFGFVPFVFIQTSKSFSFLGQLSCSWAPERWHLARRLFNVVPLALSLFHPCCWADNYTSGARGRRHFVHRQGFTGMVIGITTLKLFPALTAILACITGAQLQAAFKFHFLWHRICDHREELTTGSKLILLNWQLWSNSRTLATPQTDLITSGGYEHATHHMLMSDEGKYRLQACCH